MSGKPHQIICPRCAKRFALCACEIGKRHKVDWACFSCTEAQSILLRLSPEQANIDKFIEHGLKRFEEQLGGTEVKVNCIQTDGMN